MVRLYLSSMKLQLPSVITSITAKVDGSLGLRLSTPELSVDEKATVMGIQNKQLNVVIETVDEPDNDVYKIERELDSKTPSQRMRASLFVLWDKKHRATWKDFESFYSHQMEKMIDSIKSHIE